MGTTIDARSVNFADIVRPGDRVIWGQGCGEPLTLTELLMAQRHAIGRFIAFTGLSQSTTPDPRFTDIVQFQSYHGGGGNRRLATAGKLDILPSHYAQLPTVLAAKCDVLLVQLTPADASGKYSLGLTHDYLIPLLDRARIVVAEVNDQVPWVAGERAIDIADIDILVPTSRAPLEMPMRAADATDRLIAAHVAGLIEDGATLQLGVGALPAAILAALSDRRYLGIHSGALFDPVVDLMQAGAIANSRKTIDPGIAVTGLLLGTRKLFDFADHNPHIAMRSVGYTHDAAVLARLDKFVAINSAFEVDLTGQVNAEVARGLYLGGIGGAVDFARGAQRSRGGIPIVALRSRVSTEGTVVARLGGPVTVGRADVGVIVTEHGVADLRGLTLAERRRRMIAIAHPEDRDSLTRAAYDDATKEV